MFLIKLGLQRNSDSIMARSLGTWQALFDDFPRAQKNGTISNNEKGKDKALARPRQLKLWLKVLV